MKTTVRLSIFLLIASTHLYAQQPPIGTWEMVSIKGITASGEKFSRDTSTVREIKVITTTHYMLIAQDVEKDSLVFNRAYAGTVRFEGNKYIEVPLLASVDLYENVKTDYTWKVDGDTFIQSGTFTRPDGKKVILEEMIFHKVKTEQPVNNLANGMWELLSATYTDVNGRKNSYTNETAKCLQLITPTHWMYLSRRDNKFESAMGGTYNMKQNKFYPSVDYSSFPKHVLGQLELTPKVEEDKLFIRGTSLYPDGRKLSWEDVFQRVK
jgi:hypothetical protein